MEVLERRRNVAVAAALFIVFLFQYKSVEAHKNGTRMSYVCPPQFIRLGHSCYFFSETKATWQNALFACKDRDSNLSVPARWEDRNLREYLNKPKIANMSRWIGGVYDYGARAWKWGGELRVMNYQSFSKMKRLSPEQLQWHCIAMMPELLYRWAPQSCHEPREYICQTKLKKIPKHKVKELKRRWQRMGKINEITVPSVSREINDPRFNYVTANPVRNPKSFGLRPKPTRTNTRFGRRNVIHNSLKSNELRPNELRRPGPRANRKLRRPFAGYQWNRRDPEGSFTRNAEILHSGRTGLSPQQIKSHLVRMQHLRDKQITRRKRLRNKTNYPEKRPALVNTRSYTVDNNISSLHPKTIVEEFDMLMPPPPVAVARPNRGAG